MEQYNSVKCLFVFLLSVLVPLLASSQVIDYEGVGDSLLSAMQERMEEGMIKVGEKLPHAELRMLDGSIKSTNYYKGKPTLVFIWDVNCDKCIRSIPALNMVMEQLGSKYQYLSLINESRVLIKATLYDHPFDFDHAIPPEVYTSQLGFQVVSQLIIIDEYGGLQKIVPHSVFEKCLLGHQNACATDILSYITE